MKQKYSYEDCYKILDSSPDQSFKEIRKAYKRSVQKYHPDRIDNSNQQDASLKMQQLNAAFNQIEKHYKKNNKLPEIQQNKPAQPSNKPSTAKTKQKPKRDTTAESRHQPFNKTVNIRKKSGISKYVSLIAVVLTAYIMFYAPLETDQQEQQASAKKTVKNINKINHFTEKKQIEDLKDKKANKDTKKKLIPDFFRIGSPLGEVINVQGKPDMISKDKGTLYYGMSRVYLTDGLVSDWKRVKGSPIKARLIITNNNRLIPTSKKKNN